MKNLKFNMVIHVVSNNSNTQFLIFNYMYAIILMISEIIFIFVQCHMQYCYSLAMMLLFNVMLALF